MLGIRASRSNILAGQRLGVVRHEREPGGVAQCLVVLGDTLEVRRDAAADERRHCQDDLQAKLFVRGQQLTCRAQIAGHGRDRERAATNCARCRAGDALQLSDR